MCRPKSTPLEKVEHQWAITLIRQRGKFLGYVKAPDQETAIREAIKHFEIKDPERQKRLIVQRSDRPSVVTPLQTEMAGLGPAIRLTHRALECGGD